MMRKIRSIIEAAAQEDKEFGGGHDMVEFIKRNLLSISDYHNFVIGYMINTEVQRFELEQPDFAKWRDKMEGDRKIAHAGMLAGVAQINRFCRNHGLELLYNGPEHDKDELKYENTDARFGVADFSDIFCSQVFQIGIGKAVPEQSISEFKDKIDMMANSQDEIIIGGGLNPSIDPPTHSLTDD